MGRPELTDKAMTEFAQYMSDVQSQLISAVEAKCKEILSEAYCNYAIYLETDSWINYREALRHEMKGGLFKKVTDSEEGGWAQEVRAMILKEHKDELVSALNQDSLTEIERLKGEINRILSQRNF